MQAEQGEVYATIRDFPNYLISNQGRCFNTKTNRYIGAYDDKGYICITLHNNGVQTTRRAHDLVMEYFGPQKPEGKYQIDHSNHEKDNNGVQNLRWVTSSQNNKNKTAYNGYAAVYVDEINEDSIVVDKYGNHEFEDYLYDSSVDKFYYYTGVNFRELKINYTKTGSAFICVKDTENKSTKIYYNKFKNIYGLN